MELKLNLGKLSQGSSLKSIETVTHQKISKDELLYYFSFLKENGLLIANSYEDQKWYFPDENKDREIIFDFDIEIYRELNEALRSYTLLKRMTGRTIGTCQRILKELKRMILFTRGLKDTEALESLLVKQSSLSAYSFASNMKQFLLFYEHPNASKINEICNKVSSPDRNNRELPNFYDVLIFDEYLNNFYHTFDSDEHIRFYPVYIWWKLTNIVPMRVIELVKLKKNCVERRENGTYWITLPREKKVADSPFKIDVTDEVQINEEVYSIITKYIELIDDNNINTEYLLPYDLYVRYLPLPIGSSRQRKGTRNRIIDKYLQRMINDFYEIIIKDSSMERVTCGDTRHFAIMNMFLQGFNMLSIARMAGHDELETQINYYSHVDHYVQSKVYLLSQKKFEQGFAQEIGKPFTNSLRESYDRGLLHTRSELAEHRFVEYGYCTDINFPNNCVEDCRVCDTYFIFKPPVNETELGIKWLTDCSQSIEQKIKEQTDFIMNLTKSFHYEQNKVINPKATQLKLESASTQLMRLIDQRATVEALIMRYTDE